MSIQGRKPRLRATLAVIAAAGLALAACGRPNVERAGSMTEAAPALVSDLMHGWTIRHARPTGDQQRPNEDVALLIKVKSALVNDPELKQFPLEVGVLDGVVTLYGRVDTATRRAAAEKVARRVQGVSGVRSSIAIQAPV